MFFCTNNSTSSTYKQAVRYCKKKFKNIPPHLEQYFRETCIYSTDHIIMVTEYSTSIYQLIS